MEQLNMFEEHPPAPVTPQYAPEWPMPVRFFKFHRTNPHVLRFLENEVLKVYRAAIGQVNIQYFFVRFRLFGAGTAGDAYKISNSFSPYYSRLICMRHPEVQDTVLVLNELKGTNATAWNTVERIIREQSLQRGDNEWI